VIVMAGNIKHLAFGVCATLVLLGASVVMASAATECVEEGESIQEAVSEPMSCYHTAISSHHISDRAIGECGRCLAHKNHISFYKNSISKQKRDKQNIRATRIEKSNYTLSLHGDLRLLWGYVNDEKAAWVDCVSLGDVNGDDIADVLVSDCCDDDYYKDVFITNCDSESKLFVMSGKDGSTIWSRNYSAGTWIEMDEIDDVNGDGINEAVVCWDGYDWDTNITIELLSGSNGNSIWSKKIEGDYYTWVYGTLGDLTGDGIEDILIESEKGDGLDASVLHALDSKDGSKLWGITFSGYLEYGCYYAWGDLTGDGINDFAISSYARINNTGELSVIKGSDGSVVWHRSFIGEMGWHITWNDFDEDGISDVGIVNHDANNKTGKATIFKGTDGSVVWTRLYDHVPWMILDDCSDINTDGIRDLCLEFQNTEVQVLSGKDGSLIWKKEIGAHAVKFDDLNEDGVEDILLISSMEIVSNKYLYEVTIISGIDGSKIWKNSFLLGVEIEIPESERYGWGYGWSTGSAGADLNGDGIVDPLLGIDCHCNYRDEHASIDCEYSANKLIVINGRDGSEIGYVKYIADEDAWWNAWMTEEDFNGDGINDILLETMNGVYLLTVSETPSVTHPKNIAIRVPLVITVSASKESKITIDIGGITQTKIGKDLKFMIDTNDFEIGTLPLVVKSDSIECYRSNIMFYDPETIQIMVKELDALDNAANSELLQISGIPANCTSVLLKDVLLDHAGEKVGAVIGGVVKNFRARLDRKFGKWMRNFGDELMEQGATQDEVDMLTHSTDGVIGTIEDQAENRLNEEKDNMVDQVIDETVMLIKAPMKHAIFEIFCNESKMMMDDRTQHLKNDVQEPTEEQLEDAKRLIRIGRAAINNTDDEMIYSLDLKLTKVEPTINHFEERFELSRNPNGLDIPGLGFAIDPRDFLDISFGAGESLLTVPVHLGWMPATPYDEGIHISVIPVVGIIVAIKKIIVATDALVEASSYIILGGTFSSTPLLVGEINEEHADTINAVRDVLDGQKSYNQVSAMELNGGKLTVPPTDLAILSPDGRILEFEHIKDRSEMAFPSGEYKVVAFSAEPQAIEIRSEEHLQDDVTINARSEKDRYQLGETVNINMVIENNLDQEIDNAMLFMKVTPENNSVFTDLVSLSSNSSVDLHFNITAKCEGVHSIDTYLTMFDSILASDSASFIVGIGDFEGADLRVSYDEYYSSNNVKFDITVNNTGTINLNPILHLGEQNISLGELQVDQSITEVVELPLKDPGRYSYVLKVVDNGKVLDTETISFVVRAEDVLFASVNTDHVLYGTSEEVRVTAKVENITFDAVDVPVCPGIITPSGDFISTDRFTPEETGTYTVKAIPVAEGCVVHEDEIFFVVGEQSDLMLEISGNLTYDKTSNLMIKVKTDSGGEVTGARVVIGDVTQLTDSNGEIDFVIDPTDDTISVKAEKIGFNPDLEILKVNQPPIAYFTVTPENPIVNHPTTFNALPSHDMDGNITTYMWNFSDETTTTTKNPVITHSYTSASTYNVTLTVTDDDGLTSTISKIVTAGICGDLDHDGEISSADAAIALQIAVSGVWDAGADVNGDGYVTSLDVLMILQTAAGM